MRTPPFAPWREPHPAEPATRLAGTGGSSQRGVAERPAPDPLVAKDQLGSWRSCRSAPYRSGRRGSKAAWAAHVWLRTAYGLHSRLPVWAGGAGAELSLGFDPLLAALAATQSRELLTAAESSAGSSTCWAAGCLASAGKIVCGRRLSRRTSPRGLRPETASVRAAGGCGADPTAGFGRCAGRPYRADS